jgi:hypothetical protein
MTQYEIIQMANEAGLNSYRIAPAEAVAVWERFAALVAAKEREACALACEAEHVGVDVCDECACETDETYNRALRDGATAIRARSTT